MAGNHETRTVARAPASRILTVIYMTMIGAFAPLIALGLLVSPSPEPALLGLSWIQIITIVGAVLGFVSGITRVRLGPRPRADVQD
jgi:hypothetical protein